MSNAPLASLFQGTARLQATVASGSTWLSEAIEQAIGNLLASSPLLHDTGCDLVNLQNFLTRALQILSQLADVLVNGPQLLQYIRSSLDQAGAEDDFSTHSTLESLDEKHNTLKGLVSQLHNLSQLYHPLSGSFQSPDPGGPPSYPPPEPHFYPTFSSHSKSPYSTEPQKEPSDMGTVAPSRYSNMLDQDSESEDGDNSSAMQDTINQILGTLDSRGTGEDHYCPLGAACTKGGVYYGQLVLFTRNSAFKTHLQKHRKPFRCTLPNCPHRNFARKDQLLRHQSKVYHG